MQIKINKGEYQGNAEKIEITIKENQYTITCLVDDAVLIEKRNKKDTECLEITPLNPKRIIIK